MGLCEHGKQKYQCTQCIGTGICKHGKRKNYCVNCGGNSLCEHLKRKERCKECSGSAYCEHGKYKSRCIKCGGSSLCIHEKRKERCKECNGSAICEHSIRREVCKECHGSMICKHDKHKSKCRQCGGSQLCKNTSCESRGNKKYNGYCVFCCIHMFPEIKVSRNYRSKENAVCDCILEKFPSFSWSMNLKVLDGCSRKRPDILLDLGYQVIVIEVDENQHTQYDTSCETKRLMEISQDLQHRPLIVIRFNPDKYITQNKSIQSSWRMGKDGIVRIKNITEWESRMKILCDTVRFWLTQTADKTIHIIHLFYDNYAGNSTVNL
jgi:hypothetical protein